MVVLIFIIWRKNLVFRKNKIVKVLKGWIFWFFLLLGIDNFYKV